MHMVLWQALQPPFCCSGFRFTSGESVSDMQLGSGESPVMYIGMKTVRLENKYLTAIMSMTKRLKNFRSPEMEY